MAARQNITTSSQIATPKNHHPKKLASRQLFFLQGLPGVGPLLVARLLKKIGTPKALINGTEEELKQAEGIGGNNEKKVSGFIKCAIPGQHWVKNYL